MTGPSDPESGDVTVRRLVQNLNSHRLVFWTFFTETVSVELTLTGHSVLKVLSERGGGAFGPRLQQFVFRLLCNRGPFTSSCKSTGCRASGTICVCTNTREGGGSREERRQGEERSEERSEEDRGEEL